MKGVLYYRLTAFHEMASLGSKHLTSVKTVCLFEEGSALRLAQKHQGVIVPFSLAVCTLTPSQELSAQGFMAGGRFRADGVACVWCW